jgi:HEPN domain-containing protein
VVVFHCQQAGEKYLKAVLCEEGMLIPRTHDLNQLRVMLLPKYRSLIGLRRLVVSLSRYAVDYRYPGLSASIRQMRAALRHAERLRSEIRTILGLPL